MAELCNHPHFGVTLTLVAWLIGKEVSRRFPSHFLNPLLIAILLSIGFLLLFRIQVTAYDHGGSLINFFLAPATVVLAVPLYKKRELLKKNWFPIFAGVLVGTVSSLASIVLLCHLLQVDRSLLLSILPKSVTAPIGIEIAHTLGGIPAVAIAAIVVTGVTGALIAVPLMRLLRITDPIAQGIAIGTAAHAVGTSKAVEMGETVGAMSGLAIGLAGLLTVFLAPVVVRWLL